MVQEVRINRAVYQTGALILGWSALYETIWYGIHHVQMIHRHRYNVPYFEHVLKAGGFTPPPFIERQPYDFHKRPVDRVKIKLRYLRKLILSVDNQDFVARYDRMRPAIERLYALRCEFAHSELSPWKGDICLKSHETKLDAVAKFRVKLEGPLPRARESKGDREANFMRRAGFVVFSFEEIDAAIAELAEVCQSLRQLYADLPHDGGMVDPVEPPK